VIEEVVRVPLIEPDGLAGIRAPREHAGGPLVVAGSELSVPGARVAGARIDEIELGVIRQEPPHRSSADLPLVRRPARHAQVRASILRVERSKARSDQHLRVRTRVVGSPGDGAAVGIERREPAANAKLAPAVADEHAILDDLRRHRHRLATFNLAERRVPELPPRLGVERNGVVIERIEEELAPVVGGAAIDHITAGHALRRGHRFGLVLPLDGRPGLREIEREDDVRKRGDDVHHAVDHQRRRFVAPGEPSRERPGEPQLGDIRGLDLIEPAEARVLMIPRRHRPVIPDADGLRNAGVLRRCGRAPRRNAGGRAAVIRRGFSSRLTRAAAGAETQGHHTAGSGNANHVARPCWAGR
jgi:hypothetical protein